jgi:hypothetical protein
VNDEAVIEAEAAVVGDAALDDEDDEDDEDEELELELLQATSPVIAAIVTAAAVARLIDTVILVLSAAGRYLEVSAPA